MPSMEETRRQVQEQLKRHNEPNHDEILASLQDEIDKHNAVKDRLRRSMRKDETLRARDRDSESMRFRFKEHVSDPRRKRKHRSKHDDQRRKSQRTLDEDAPAHPFRREPTTRPDDATDPTDAFRESLFDALADDEGAQYWEGVYNQPIHIYPRPTVQTAKGELEEMNDDEYAAYVKTKMWEKKNPHVLLERERSERKQKQAEEARTREREDFIRRKQQTAWQRAQAYAPHDRDNHKDEYEYVADKTEFVSDSLPSQKARKQHAAAAWAQYLQAWDDLKRDLLAARQGSDATSSSPAAAARIPWPVLGSKAVTKANIEEFMHNCLPPPAGATAATGHDQLLQRLKAERVRWHPDKVQQRFGGTVDQDTLKTVTSIFQVVDALLERLRKAQ